MCDTKQKAPTEVRAFCEVGLRCGTVNLLGEVGTGLSQGSTFSEEGGASVNKNGDDGGDAYEADELHPSTILKEDDCEDRNTCQNKWAYPLLDDVLGKAAKSNGIYQIEDFHGFSLVMVSALTAERVFSSFSVNISNISIRLVVSLRLFGGDVR